MTNETGLAGILRAFPVLSVEGAKSRGEPDEFIICPYVKLRESHLFTLSMWLGWCKRTSLET